MLSRVGAETAEHDAGAWGEVLQSIEDRPHRDARGALGREAVNAGRDGGKGYGGEPALAE